MHESDHYGPIDEIGDELIIKADPVNADYFYPTQINYRQLGETIYSMSHNIMSDENPVPESNRFSFARKVVFAAYLFLDSIRNHEPVRKVFDSTDKPQHAIARELHDYEPTHISLGPASGRIPIPIVLFKSTPPYYPK